VLRQDFLIFAAMSLHKQLDVRIFWVRDGLFLSLAMFEGMLPSIVGRICRKLGKTKDKKATCQTSVY
jgi:hypothetical protein